MGRFSGARADPGATIVYSLSAEADALSDCPKQKGLQMQAFLERLKGFEPSTFCMASRTCASRPAPNNAANKPFSAPARARRNTRDSPGNHGGYWTQTGPSLVVLGLSGVAKRRPSRLGIGCWDGSRTRRQPSYRDRAEVLLDVEAASDEVESAAASLVLAGSCVKRSSPASPRSKVSRAWEGSPRCPAVVAPSRSIT
jgi:hypothetical protein